MLLYYITDRKQFLGTEDDRRRSVFDRIEQAARAGVDYIQLREKDLSSRELERLGKEALRRVRDVSGTTRLLINSRTDVALATGVDGVHLTSADISAADARALWTASVLSRTGPATSSVTVIGVSCHSLPEVRLAESYGADFVVLAPIFEKLGTDVLPLGLQALRHVTRSSGLPDARLEAAGQRTGIPVLALGGVNVENAVECLRAGAAGIAGIRIFQTGDIRRTVEELRRLGEAANATADDAP